MSVKRLVPASPSSSDVEVAEQPPNIKRAHRAAKNEGARRKNWPIPIQCSCPHMKEEKGIAALLVPNVEPFQASDYKWHPWCLAPHMCDSCKTIKCESAHSFGAAVLNDASLVVLCIACGARSPLCDDGKHEPLLVQGCRVQVGYDDCPLVVHFNNATVHAHNTGTHGFLEFDPFLHRRNQYSRDEYSRKPPSGACATHDRCERSQDPDYFVRRYWRRCTESDPKHVCPLAHLGNSWAPQATTPPAEREEDEDEDMLLLFGKHFIMTKIVRFEV